MKTCSSCKVEKLAVSFHKRTLSKDGLHSYCKECTTQKNKAWGKANKEKQAESCSNWYKKNRAHAIAKGTDWHYKAHYGISYEEFLAMAKAQNNQCAICAVDLVFDKRCSERAVLDHDHDTGENRGVLCNGCNTGIGLLKDSASVLTKAASYLTKYSKG